MARRTKKKAAPKASTRSKKNRVKNAGKKGGARVIPGKVLLDFFKGKDPLAFHPTFAVGQIMAPSDVDMFLSGDIKMKQTPSGLLISDERGDGRVILPTATTYKEAEKALSLSPASWYSQFPGSVDELNVLASPNWLGPETEAINVLEAWQYKDNIHKQQYPLELLVLPTKASAKGKSLSFSEQELLDVARQHGVADLLPPIEGDRFPMWGEQELAAAQEAVTDATGHEFGEHDPTFVAPVTEEGWEMLDEIYKEGVAPKRSSNPQTLHVTPRMKKIAAQIDRQLADLPQNATLTDRQVKQIIAALAA